jgi:hypothetical protein
MKKIVSTSVAEPEPHLLPCYTVGSEPEPHKIFYSEPEPHKNDAAPQHWIQHVFKLLFFFKNLPRNFDCNGYIFSFFLL